MGLTTKKYFRRLLYAKIVLILVAGISLSIAGVLWSLPADIGGGYHNVQAMLRGIQKVLFWRLIIYCGITLVFMLPAMVWILLFYSHRIAGPTYKIGQEALRIGQGDLAGGVRFRRLDGLTEMADSLNDLTAWYRDRLDAVKASLVVIDQQSNTICGLIREGGDHGSTLKGAAKEISDKIIDIERSLRKIRI